MNNDAALAPALPGTSHTSPTFWTLPRITFSVLATLLVVALGLLLGIFANWRNSTVIANGIFVQGESLGGLTQDEAEERLNQRFGRVFLSIETPARGYHLGLSQLGGQIKISDAVNKAYWYGRDGNSFVSAWKYWTAQQSDQNSPLPVTWNKNRLRRSMWTIATAFNQEPRDARLKVTGAGIQVESEENGRAMNVGATCAKLQNEYYVGKPSVEAVTEELMPRLTSADLTGTDVLLGKYTTRFNPGLVGRTRNVNLAAEAINGKVILPDERFSFNEMTGERTPAKGYRVAHIFIRKPGAKESEIVDGVGGGVCQVSSTLYNAVRKTNSKTQDRLAIVERNNHSLPVPYVPSGLDATVAWPNKDFRFRNTFRHPVYIRTEIKKSRLTISIWGRVPGDVESVTVSSPDKQASTGTDSPT